MSTKQSIQGKGNLLDFIHEKNPELTGRYIRIRGDDKDAKAKAVDFMKSTGSEEGYILRSDALCEDGFGASFAGMYNSFPVTPETFELISHHISIPHDLATQNPELVMPAIEIVSGWGENKLRIPTIDGFDRERGRTKVLKEAENILRYAQFRGIDISESRMDFILHENLPMKYEVLISEHPNMEGGIHYEYRENTGASGMVSWDVRINELKHGGFDSRLKPIIQQFWDVTRDLDDSVVYVAEIAGDFDRIVQLRPYFKTQKTEENYNWRSLGVCNPEGLEFELQDKPEPKKYYYDFSKDQYYPGLVFFGGEPQPSNLPVDVVRNEPTRLIVSRNPWNVYLSHAGLKMLEATEVFSSEYNVVDFLRRAFGKDKKLKFEQRPNDTHGAFRFLYNK